MNPQYMQPRPPYGASFDYGPSSGQPTQAAPPHPGGPHFSHPSYNGPPQQPAMGMGPAGPFPAGKVYVPPNPALQGKQTLGGEPGSYPHPGMAPYSPGVHTSYQNGASSAPPPPVPQNYPQRMSNPMPSPSANTRPPVPHFAAYQAQPVGVRLPPGVQHQIANQMNSMTLNPPPPSQHPSIPRQAVEGQPMQPPSQSSGSSPRPPPSGAFPNNMPPATLPSTLQPSADSGHIPGPAGPPGPMQNAMQYRPTGNVPPTSGGPPVSGSQFSAPHMYASPSSFPPTAGSGAPLMATGMPPSGRLPPPGGSFQTNPPNSSQGQFDSVNGFGGSSPMAPSQPPMGGRMGPGPNSQPSMVPQYPGSVQPQFQPSNLPPGMQQHPAMSPGYNRMPSPGAAPGPIHPQQQQPQQQRRLDPEMMPSPIQVIEDDRKNREGVFCTNQRGQVPPLVTTNFVTQDQGNCNPRFMRSSMYALPNSPDMIKQTAIPFTISISPFARLVNGEQPPPIVQLNEIGPVRCIRCKAYMCPYMQFVDGGRRFQCSFCKATTEVPVEYFAHLDHTGQRVDKYERPELCLGSYEFIATKDYCRNNIFPMPPAFIFVIDVSYNNVKNGVVKLLCQNMKSILANLPRENEAAQGEVQVGFITYSNSVHFYNLKDCLAQPQVMIVPDVQDMFMPLLDGFLVGVEESETIIDNLMEQIPKMYEDSRETETILGPAIKAGLEALKAADRSGKLFVFHSSLPIAEAPGKLKNRDDRKLLGTEKEKTILAPQSTFYGQLGQECVTAGCSVDLFTFPNAYIDIATIGQVCRLTGGQLHKYTYFVEEIDGSRLIEDLSRTIRNQCAFDAIMRVRTSTGIRPTDFFGNFFMSNTTDVEIAAIDTEKGLCVEIKHDDKLTDEEAVFIQTAVLYTSTGGQRRLRIHNLSLSTCNQLADLYRNCELDVLMNYFSKACLRQLCDQTPKQVKDVLINKCAQSLACYRKNCASPSSAGQLILPECMKLFPLYVNCLLKSDAVSGGSDMATDDRSYAMHALNVMDVKASLGYIYPRLIAIHGLEPNSSQMQQMPSALRCSAEKLKETGVYLLENGTYMFLWIGLNVDPDWLHDVFGVQSAAQIDIDKSHLLDLDNPNSQRVRWIIKEVREERQRYMKLFIIRQRDKLETVFRQFLVEDKGLDGSPSYVDFLCHIHKEIRNLLN